MDDSKDRSADAVSKSKFFIGALSDDAGGVVFNNRVIVSNLLEQRTKVVFFNYSRKNVDIADRNLVMVGLCRFVYGLAKEKPGAVWVHTSRLHRFILYYAVLLPFIFISGSRINVVLHSGRVNVGHISRLPLVEIYLLDHNVYERHMKMRNVHPFTSSFVSELNQYLSRESKQLSEMSPRIAEIVRTRKYILTTGYVNKTYNFNALIKAYLQDRSTDVALLILSYGEITPGQYTKEFFKLVEAPGVIHIRDISRCDYIGLLSNSLVLVRATLWDSFGIAMYEAHYYNTPVVASRVSNYRPGFAQLFDLRDLSATSLLQLIDGASAA